MKKRLIALLLILALAAALCACGKADPAQANEKYAKYDSLIQRIEAGDYDGASACLRGFFGKQEPEQTQAQSDPAQTGEQTEPATQQTEPAPTETEIEINLDNWQEYFEFKLIPYERRNAFDEFEGFYTSYRMFVKEAWAGIVTDADMAIEVARTDSSWYRCAYNIDTKEIVQVQRLTDEACEAANYHIRDDSSEICRFAGSCLENGMGLYGTEYQSDSCTLEGNIASVVVLGYEHVEILRIQGTLTVRR